MASIDTLNRQADTQTESDESWSNAMERRLATIQARYKDYMRVTFYETGAASWKQTTELSQWVEKMTATKSAENLRNLEGMRDFLSQHEQSAKDLYYREFLPEMDKAVSQGIISTSSAKKWVTRFKDPTVGYKEKEKWVREKLPELKKKWQKAMGDRLNVFDSGKFATMRAKDPSLKFLKDKGIDVATFLDKGKFLELHYDKKRDLIARIHAAMNSIERGNEDLHKRAKQILAGPVKDGAMSADRVGSLLKRIFDGTKSRPEIEEYLATGIHNDIRQRYQVLSKYDAIASKIQKRGKVRVRGMNLIPRAAFTKMTYKERLAYVKEMDLRLVGANDIRKENPLFLTIRHLLDMKDWKGASEKIKQAEATRETMSDSEKSNFDSMKNYLKRMRKDKKGDSGTKEKKSPMEEAMVAYQTMNNTVKNMDTSMRPMVERLLRSSHANRNIHQLRWGIYNRTWCENRGYLDNEKLRKGASKENRIRTKWRGDRGLDIGREDNLDGTTAHANYVRKKEHARNKPTNLHLDVKDASATQKLAEFMENEQPPKRLYWLNICANDDGKPKTSEWNKKFISELTALRAAAKTMEKAGLMYGGLGLPPVPFIKTTSGPPVIQN